MSECIIDTGCEVVKLTGERLVDIMAKAGFFPGKKYAILFPDETAAERFYNVASTVFDHLFGRIRDILPTAIEFRNGSKIVLEVCKGDFVHASHYDEVFFYDVPRDKTDEDTPFDSDNETLDAYLKSFVINADTV